jgi:hypothetical protein
LFDGKLGIWPFITVEPVQHSSHNQPRGMLMKKAVTSVINVEYQQFILEKVLPVIEEKWPQNHEQSSYNMTTQSHTSGMIVGSRNYWHVA